MASPVRSSGMALIIVLALSTILLISALSLFKSGQQYRFQISRAKLELQAQYMAMSALQHAELKVRYFPTELYDASEYSLGKNPFFDFTELSDASYTALSAIRKAEYGSASPYFHRACSANAGPRFISEGTLSTDNQGKWFNLVNLDAYDKNPSNFSGKAAAWFPSTKWPGTWPTEEDSSLVANSDLYLWKFRSDISTLASCQAALNCEFPTPVNPFTYDINDINARTPYDSRYEVIKIRVLSVEGQQRMNQEAVKITAIGVAKDPISPANQMIQKLDKIIKVTRR